MTPPPVLVVTSVIAWRREPAPPSLVFVTMRRMPTLTTNCCVALREVEFTAWGLLSEQRMPMVNWPTWLAAGVPLNMALVTNVAPAGAGAINAEVNRDARVSGTKACRGPLIRWAHRKLVSAIGWNI